MVEMSTQKPRNQLPTTVPEILALLRLFNQEAETLYEYDFHREATTPGNGFSVELQRSRPAAYSRKGASKQMTHATICVLRKLVQQQDTISFDQIVEMHQSLHIPPDRKQRSKKQLSILEQYLSGPLAYACNGWAITRRELFDTFMYGKYAHSKSEHVRNYEMLTKPPFGVMVESDFEDVLLTYIEVALWYKAQNEWIFGFLAE